MKKELSYYTDKLRSVELPRVWYCITLALALFLVYSLWSTLCDRCVLACDSLFGVDDEYLGKLRGEGRWVNYLLFHVLKNLDLQATWFISFLCFFLFSYKVARNCHTSRYICVLIGLGALFLPQVCLLADWPFTLITMYIIGAFAAFSHRNLSIPVFFIIYGILFCGCVSSLYFALPLLFLNRGVRDLVKVFLWWIAGYVIGYLVANACTWLICGRFIQLASWRNPRYVTDITSLCENLGAAYKKFMLHVDKIDISLLILFAIAVVYYIWTHRSELKRVLCLSVLCVAVLLSVYGQAVPAGLGVSFRTAIPLFGGIYFITMLVFTRKENLLYLAMTIFCLGSFITDSNGLEKVNAHRSRIVNQFEKLEANPSEISTILLLTSQSELSKASMNWWRKTQKHNELMDFAYTPVQWACAPMALGFKRSQVITDPARSLKILKEKKVDVDTLIFTKKSGFEYVIVNDMLVLKIVGY